MRTKKNNFGDHPEKFITESGTGIKRMFHGVLNRETGEIELKEDEPKNMYEYIQSFKDSVDINKIVERFRNGEIDIFDKVQGFYDDVSNAPKDLMDAYGKIEEARYNFDRLPSKIKDKFENDFNKYLASAGTEEWIKKISSKEEEEKVKTEEVKEE